jgi:NTE family protein
MTQGSGSVAIAPARARRVAAPLAVLAVAVLGSSMAFVDASSVNIAVPNIAARFGSPLSHVSWVLNAYNIVFAAFLVGGGQLADLLGRRRAFAVSIVAFTFASALCALAPTLNLLIAARVLEAAAGALLVPSSLAIVLEAHAARERTHAVGIWVGLAALAAGIATPLGALLITLSSWRLVFLVNVPLGLLAFALSRRVIVESRTPGRRSAPDLLGGLMLALAIATMVLAIVKSAEWGWGNVRVWGSLLAALLLGASFLVRSKSGRRPVLEASLLRIPSFAMANGATLVMAGGFFAYTLGNVLFLTNVWHYSILRAGLALTPEPIVAVLLAEPTIRLVRRLTQRLVLILGALVWAGGMAYFALRIGARPNFLGDWLPGMAILGVGGGLTLPSLSAIAIDAVPGPRFALASALNSVSTQLGAALGVALLIAIAGAETLDALRNAWIFAGGCLLAGAVPCVALAITYEAESHPLEGGASAAAGRPRAPAASSRPELPRLAEAEGERAELELQSVADFLRNVQVFAQLPQELRERIAELADDVSIARGEWLFREGDPADAVYVVRVGHLEVVQEQPEWAVLNTLTRGAVLGELALLSGSPRSGSIRALRDTEALKIDKRHFDELLASSPELARALTRVLSHQLQESRALPAIRRARPVTIALRALDEDVPLLDLVDELSAELCAFGKVAVIYRGEHDRLEQPLTRAEAAARFAAIIERCERDHDHVIMACGPGAPDVWDEFCLARADRVLALAGPLAARRAAAALDATAEQEWIAGLHGCDLVGYGVEAFSAREQDWVGMLAPTSTFAVSDVGDRREDVARMARRLAGRSLGIVLGGAGARSLAHLGVIEVLLDAGVPIDRVGGVSLGAFIGALLAAGNDSAAIDACCYDEWVRRNPINDYTIPRASLIKGRKIQAMLARLFGEARIEQLSRSLYCASVDLEDGSLRIDRDGPLAEAIAASIALPLIAPPIRREQSLLIDGSLLDNLPLAPMSASGEGSVLAVDVKRDEELPPSASSGQAAARSARPRRLPPLTDTMARIALLSSANTEAAARLHADLAINVPLSGVGLLEFHQIDAARSAGRKAAQAALEQAPAWLFGEHSARRNLSGQRTVLRV